MPLSPGLHAYFSSIFPYPNNQELHGMSTNNMQVTNELHKIRAHLLHYTSLLEDFRKSVSFVLNTRNPAMDCHPLDQQQLSRELLKNECNNLLMQIERLQMSRSQQDKRLKNVMNLVSNSPRNVV